MEVIDYGRALEVYRQRWLAIDEDTRQEILAEQAELRRR